MRFEEPTPRWWFFPGCWTLRQTVVVLNSYTGVRGTDEWLMPAQVMQTSLRMTIFHSLSTLLARGRLVRTAAGKCRPRLAGLQLLVALEFCLVLGSDLG